MPIAPSDCKATLRARGICVIVPTYNNVGTVAAVIDEVRNYCDDVIVVNDGSTDGTAEMLRGLGGITLVDYADNRGKGHALREGFRRARAMGFAYAITLDADGQHYPSCIPQFLEANKQHPGALIVGNRRLADAERSKGSSFANRFANFWFAFQTWRRGIDTQSGYRLYPLKKLRALSLLTARYEAELELLVFGAWRGTPLAAIDIPVYYPPREERVSHFRPGADFLRITALNTVLCVLAVCYGWPRMLLRKAGQMCRTAFVWTTVILLLIFFFTPFVWVWFHLGPVTDDKRARLRRLIWRTARTVILRRGIPGVKATESVEHVLATGESNVEAEAAHPSDLSTLASEHRPPTVIICNHQSHIDILFQLMFVPNAIYLIKDWVWRNPFYGVIVRRAEYQPVKDGVGELLPKLRELVKKGCHIAVYPEGTRSEDCSIGRFHKGAFYIARELGLDITPMYLYGPGKVLPKGRFLMNRGRIHVEVGAPITQAELSAMGDLRQQAREVRRRYRAKYEQLCNKIEQDV